MELKGKKNELFTCISRTAQIITLAILIMVHVCIFKKKT